MKIRHTIAGRAESEMLDTPFLVCREDGLVDIPVAFAKRVSRQI